MPRDFSRTRRIEEQLCRDLAKLIHSDVREPGLGMFSVSDVRVSPDLSRAKVFISILQNDEMIIHRTMGALQAYAGRLRGGLGKRMHIRAVPRLEFIYDDLIQKGAQLNRIIEKAVDEDRHKVERFGKAPDSDQQNQG